MNNKEKKSRRVGKMHDVNKILEKIKRERDEFRDKYKRALADYQNLAKRQMKEKEELIKYSNEKLIKEMIPVFDNLKMAMKHVDKNNKNDKWVQGVGYVVKQFREVLNKNGVEEIQISDKFNPETMEAIDGNGEKVKQEVKSGYTLYGKVIIPSSVILEDK